MIANRRSFVIYIWHLQTTTQIYFTNISQKIQLWIWNYNFIPIFLYSENIQLSTIFISHSCLLQKKFSFGLVSGGNQVKKLVFHSYSCPNKWGSNYFLVQSGWKKCICVILVKIWEEIFFTVIFLKENIWYLCVLNEFIPVAQQFIFSCLHS